jgi:hypothetical protein
MLDDLAIPVTFQCGGIALLHPLYQGGQISRHWFILELPDSQREVDARLLQWRFHPLTEHPVGDPNSRVELVQMALEILPCLTLEDALRPAPAGFY